MWVLGVGALAQTWGEPAPGLAPRPVRQTARTLRPGAVARVWGPRGGPRRTRVWAGTAPRSPRGGSYEGRGAGGAGTGADRARSSAKARPSGRAASSAAAPRTG